MLHFQPLDMITGAVMSQLHTSWNAFWSGRVSNSIAVIEQLTYPLFMRQSDDRQRAAENAANLLRGEPDPNKRPSRPMVSSVRTAEDFRY